MVTLTPDKNKISVQIELSEGDLGLRETRILRLDSKTGLSELPATVGQVLGDWCYDLSAAPYIYRLLNLISRP